MEQAQMDHDGAKRVVADLRVRVEGQPWLPERSVAVGFWKYVQNSTTNPHIE